jgi:hypothetical protein
MCYKLESDQENVIVFATSLPLQRNLCLYFPCIVHWLYNWALSFPNVLAKRFICVFVRKNTYNLLPISYVYHVVITDWRKLVWHRVGIKWYNVHMKYCGNWFSITVLLQNGLLCAVIILTAESIICLEAKEILVLVHHSKSRFMWCTYAVCILSLVTFVCMQIHTQTLHIHIYSYTSIYIWVKRRCSETASPCISSNAAEV